MKNAWVLLMVFWLGSLSFSAKKHPYHVGALEVNYSEKSKTFQITGKYFLDDLEAALQAKYQKNLHFGEEKYRVDLQKYLADFAVQNFRLKSNNQEVAVKFLGYEEAGESVRFYLESAPHKKPKKVEVSVSFLYNYFKDQMSIIHIIVNGERKSSKLTYPERYLYQAF